MNTEQYAEIYSEVQGGQVGQSICRFPSGLRIITDRKGSLKAVVGMSVRLVEGNLVYRGVNYSVRVAGNETLLFDEGIFRSISNPGVIVPSYE